MEGVDGRWEERKCRERSEVGETWR